MTQPPELVAERAARSPRGAGCLRGVGEWEGGFLISFDPAVDSLMVASEASGGSGRAFKCTDEALAGLDKPCGVG